MFKYFSKFMFFLMLAVVMVGCSEPQPIPIDFNKDHCDNCRMTIADSKFGGELVTKKGKVYKFDAIECLTGFILDGTLVPQNEIHSLWVIDITHPGDFIKAETAHYFHSENIKSPMGMNISAINTAKDLGTMKFNFTGKELTWDEVIAMAKAIHNNK